MGFPLGLSGQDLTDRAVSQAEKFGTELCVPERVSAMECDTKGGHVLTIGDRKVTARTVILAPGAEYRKLGVDDLARFENQGVYYSATSVERILCDDKPIAVVGGGNSAGQAAVFMSENAHRVFLVIRGEDLRRQMSNYLARRIERSDNITVLNRTEICALHGDKYLESVTFVDRSTGRAWDEELAGVFVMIGAIPNTSWLPKEVVCDEKGFILTGPKTAAEGHWKGDRDPLFLETCCPGVFAAGDARCGSIKRVASAVGEGSMAVAFVHEYLAQ
jgi:thioredoxin reductase (NADPH)